MMKTNVKDGTNWYQWNLKKTYRLKKKTMAAKGRIFKMRYG